MADISVTNNNFTKIVSGLIPATNYGVTIDAMTSAGGVESAPLKVKTLGAGEWKKSFDFFVIIILLFCCLLIKW